MIVKPTPSQEKTGTISGTATSATVTPDSGKLLSKVTVTCNKEHVKYNEVSAKLQASKTVTASTTDKDFTPDTGYDAIKKITVKPTPSHTETVTAGTSSISVKPDSGKLLSKVTVEPTPSQTKTVTAGTSSTSVTPDSGKLLSKVTVNPTPSASKEVTPDSFPYTVSPASGKLLSEVKVKAPSGLSAGNIKKGVKIAGVTGTYEGEGINSFTVTLHSYSKDESSSEVTGNGSFELPASANVSKVELISASNNSGQNYTYVNVYVDDVLKSPMGYDGQQFTAVTKYKNWDGQTFHWINSSEDNVDPKTINVGGKALKIKIGSDGARTGERDVTAKFKIYFQ